MVGVDEVRKRAAMAMFFGENNQEEEFEQHVDYVKKEIYSELEKVESEHYFWKWCKDNFELFDTYDVMQGCLLTGDGKSTIYGDNVCSDNLILSITDERCAGIFLQSDRIYQYWFNPK